MMLRAGNCALGSLIASPHFLPVLFWPWASSSAAPLKEATKKADLTHADTRMVQPRLQQTALKFVHRSQQRMRPIQSSQTIIYIRS